MQINPEKKERTRSFPLIGSLITKVNCITALARYSDNKRYLHIQLTKVPLNPDDPHIYTCIQSMASGAIRNVEIEITIKTAKQNSESLGVARCFFNILHPWDYLWIPLEGKSLLARLEQSNIDSIIISYNMSYDTEGNEHLIVSCKEKVYMEELYYREILECSRIISNSALSNRDNHEPTKYTDLSIANTVSGVYNAPRN